MIRQCFQQVEQNQRKRVTFMGLLGGGLFGSKRDKPEFQEDGLLVHGRLIQWDQIHAWDWEEVGTALVLDLEVNRSANFPNPIRLQVPSAQRDAVETLLVDSIVSARFAATRSLIVNARLCELPLG